MGKVILTGSTGFIGRNFLNYLEDNQFVDKSEVVLISSESITGYFCIDRNHSGWKSELNQFLNGESPEVVFHLGSFTPKSGSEADNIEGSFSNILFTQELIDSIVPPKCFVFTSSLDLYDFKEVVDESCQPNPSSLYASSKLYCEKMLDVWARSSDVKLQVIRVGHVYGAGEESYKKLIPVTIETCLNGKNPNLHTSGLELRSFIYISDVCKMIYDCSSFESSIGVVNLVGNDPMSVKEVVETIIKLTNPTLECKINNKTSGISTRFSNSKMLELFGNKLTPFSVGIENEIRYFKLKKEASIRTIYLDLDGTLIDARKRLYQLYVDLSSSIISFEDYWIYKREQRSNYWLLEHIENYSIEKIEEFKSVWMEKIELKEYLDFDEPFPQVRELLSQLASSSNLVLITGRQSYDNLIWQLEKFDMAKYFKRILHTANKISKEKKIQSYTNIFQTDDIIVGDTGIEVIAGKNLGIRTVAVLSGFRNKESLERYQPDFIFSNIHQLTEFSETNN